jgi:two-component system OmpR family response regulator
MRMTRAGSPAAPPDILASLPKRRAAMCAIVPSRSRPLFCAPRWFAGHESRHREAWLFTSPTRHTLAEGTKAGGKLIVSESKRSQRQGDNRQGLRHRWSMLENKQPRVLIVDDDHALGLMLREFLQEEGFEVALATNGLDGLAEALGGHHDVVVLDIMLPGLNGIDVLRRLRQTSQVPVIMLTARGDNIDRVVGLEVGADDYVPKPCFPRELVARLRAILRRQRDLPEAQAGQLRCGSLEVDVAARRALVSGASLSLTSCEFDLLAALVRCGANIATKSELSLKVLGRVRQAYDRSVDVHISNLRQKMHEVAGAPEIETVRGLGYRLRLTGQ